MPAPAIYAMGVVVNAPKERPYDPRATFPFSELPGVIRNRIYNLIFPDSRVLLLGSHPRPGLKRQTNTIHFIDERPKPRSRLVCMIDGEPIPTSFLRVCRFITEEALEYMYANATICFGTMKAANKFLDTASKTGLKSVTSIELCHSTYGEPKLLDMRVWKSKHDQKWAQVCTRLSVELSFLQRLALDLRICDWPTQLSSKAGWARPLMVLKGTGLDQVNLTLRSSRFSAKRVCTAANKMETLMMSEEGKKRRELEEALRQVREMEAAKARKTVLPPVQAVKTLAIKDIPASKMASSERVHKFTRLAGYTRIDLATAGLAFF